MNEMGKLLIIAGIFLVIFGVIVVFGSKLPFVGKLPGDFLIKRDGFTFYFPIVTSIIISILLTVILNLFNKK